MSFVELPGIQLVDMCSLQSPPSVDFRKMKDSGIRGVYFKASQYSSSIDPTFAIGVKRATEAGLHCGAYHFAYCGRDPAAQMSHFVKAAAGLGANPGELPPMLDWEYAENGDDGKPLTEEATVAWLVSAAAECKRIWYPYSDRMPTIYTYPEFARQHQKYLDLATELSQYPLTLAGYPQLHKPPKPWTKVTIHQYAGNDGRAPGVAVACDRDRFLGTDEEFEYFLGLPRPTGNKLVPDELTAGSGGIIHDMESYRTGTK